MTADTRRERIARQVKHAMTLYGMGMKNELSRSALSTRAAELILAELGAGWRDIADAPRNEYVLVAIPSLDTPLVYGLLEFDGDSDLPRWYSADGSAASPLDIDPTHWMPLPPTPEVKS